MCLFQKNLFAKILITAFFLSIIVSFSQTNEPGQWSLIINGNDGGNFGVSDAMNGTVAEFVTDLSVDYNNRKLPFGEDGTESVHYGFQFSYKFSESPYSIYFGGNTTVFYIQKTDYGYSHARMNIITVPIGIEYTIGEPTDIWNIFGRCGLNLNLIWARDTYIMKKYTNFAYRGGGEIELGGRLNIPSTPLSLELSAAYLNTNIFGKSYTRFSERPPEVLDERELNDGKNPDNPSDINRTIDFITLKGGIRLWF